MNASGTCDGLQAKVGDGDAKWKPNRRAGFHDDDFTLFSNNTITCVRMSVLQQEQSAAASQHRSGQIPKQQCRWWLNCVSLRRMTPTEDREQASAVAAAAQPKLAADC
jgi:hypothetical protein